MNKAFKRTTKSVFFLSLFLGIMYFVIPSLSHSATDRQQMFNIKVSSDDTIYYTVIRSVYLNPSYNKQNIFSQNLSEASIEIDQNSYTLQDALASNKVSVDEIILSAHTDAINGFCREKAESDNGLATFIYLYEDFQLATVYDILEAPDGEKHIINSIAISKPGADYTQKYYDAESPYLYYLDREDWGLAFSVADVTSTGIEFQCSQSSGQQLGQLEITNYYLTLEEYLPNGTFITPQSNDFRTIPIPENTD